jgi:hypothetical protein
MRKRVLAVAAVCVVALALAGSLAWAEDAMYVNVRFNFIVGDKVMQAGEYKIQREPGPSVQLRVETVGAGGVAITKVLERLANTGGKEGRVVFDKTDDGKCYLSEVQFPGMDGYLVGIAGGNETHEVITAKEKKQP